MKKAVIISLIAIILIIFVGLSFLVLVGPHLLQDVNNPNIDNYVENNNNNNYFEENKTGNSNTITVNTNSNGKKSTINFTSSKNKITIEELKNQFKASGVDDSNKYMFKPFYNVEPNTEFTFHFNSKVDPIKAITVHTDEKCDYLSLVWQINEAYWTEDGIDVIVGPSSTGTVLYTEGRNGAEKGVWGYAPIYYLCIKYDLDSKEVKKLDEPIIIPFTVKNEISTPTVYANIDENGTFSVKWNKVDGAVSYKVYSGNSSKVASLTSAETGYQDSPKLLATLKSSTLEFNPGYILEKDVLGGEGAKDNTVRQKDEKYGIELVSKQNSNLYNLHALYVTAVDSRGNESNFGIPVMLNKYKESLPQRVKVSELNRYTDLESLPQTVSVESVDMKTSAVYPINFYKIENPGEYDSYCDYRYEVVNTSLTGIVSLKSEDKIFPEKSLSSYVPQTSYMPQNTMDKIPEVTVDTFADNEYSNSNIDLKRKTNYPEGARVQLDAGNLYMLVDSDMARRSIGKIDINATDPREEFDSFVADDNPEYIVRREGNTLIVEKADKQGNSSTSEPEKEPIKEHEKEPTKEPEKEVEKKPAEVIDNVNYVEEQRKSTEKQVEKANKEEVEGTKYPVFADNAAQMYLALAMINQEEQISLKAFPEYQNPQNVYDDVLYLWYQNPYIMGIDNSKIRIDYKNQNLYLQYNVPKATAKKYQEAVYKKSQQVVNKIIKDNMTDSEKVFAIYDYLEQNAEYNHEALKYASKVGTDVYKKYPNSWNTYGILCEELGVCQSYAYAFDLLAYMSGVDSVMVTGTMNNGGHAWNAVNLSGKWYMVDVTNNGNSVVPYWICNSSSDFIKDVAFVLDEGFVDGTDYSEYYNSSDKEDWYYKNGLMVDSGAELAKIWEKKHKTQETIIAKCTINTNTELNTLMNDFAKQVSKDGYSQNDLIGWEVRAGLGCVILIKQ